MHFELSTILALLSATTVALATNTNTTLPTAYSNSTIHTLEKRAKPGWVSSFSNPKCEGPAAANKLGGLKWNFDDCHKWSPDPAQKFVGVNYGSGNIGIALVVFYADDQCKYAIGGTLGDAKIGDGEVWQENNMGMKCE